MRSSTFTEEQIAFAVKQVELDVSVAECCRKLGIGEQTVYRWKKKYGGIGMSEVRRLKQLVADLSLDNGLLHDPLQQKL